MNARWRKAWSDLRRRPRRSLLALLAGATAIAAIVSVVAADAVLRRDIPRNYERTMPPHAVLRLERLSTSWVEAIRAREDVQHAEAKRVLWARARTSETRSVPIRLLVEPDLREARIGRQVLEDEATPPIGEELLIERASLSVARRELGQELEVSLPGREPVSWTIRGRVHDPALAPGWMERMVYGVVQPEALRRLGLEPELNELWLRASRDGDDRAALRRWAEDVRRDLVARGAVVESIVVPPPGEHPHQVQMDALLYLLRGLGMLIGGLGIVLLSLVLSSLMHRETPQIGAMKAMGARSSQIVGLYLLSLGILTGAAGVVGIPAGLGLGSWYAQAASSFLNFELLEPGFPAFVGWSALGVALGVPALAGILPILLRCRRPVRALIAAQGSGPVGDAGTRHLLGRPLELLPRSLRLAVRNAARRPGRSLLAGVTLSVAGLVFLVSSWARDAWIDTVDDLVESRSADVQLTLGEPASRRQLAAALQGLEGVRELELWNSREVELATAAGDTLGLRVVSIPRDTAHHRPELLQGSWLSQLSPTKEPARVVLGHDQAEKLEGVRVGDRLVARFGVQEVELRLAGIVSGFGPFSLAYVDREEGGVALGLDEEATQILASVDGEGADAQWEMVARIERRLERAGVVVEGARPREMFRHGLVAHIDILLDLLRVAAGLIAGVGALGLLSAMSLGVLERSREIAVLRAIGGSPRAIMSSLIAEGIAISLASAAVASVVSWPLARWFGDRSSDLFLGIPLEWDRSARPVLVLVLAAVVLGALASVLPARRATRRTVSEVLSEG